MGGLQSRSNHHRRRLRRATGGTGTADAWSSPDRHRRNPASLPIPDRRVRTLLVEAPPPTAWPLLPGAPPRPGGALTPTTTGLPALARGSQAIPARTERLGGAPCVRARSGRRRGQRSEQRRRAPARAPRPCRRRGGSAATRTSSTPSRSQPDGQREQQAAAPDREDALAREDREERRAAAARDHQAGEVGVLDAVADALETERRDGLVARGRAPDRAARAGRAWARRRYGSSPSYSWSCRRRRACRQCPRARSRGRTRARRWPARSPRSPASPRSCVSAS